VASFAGRHASGAMSLVRDLSRMNCCSVHLALAASQGFGKGIAMVLFVHTSHQQAITYTSSSNLYLMNLKGDVGEVLPSMCCQIKL
jgi:hypothetical protein